MFLKNTSAWLGVFSLSLIIVFCFGCENDNARIDQTTDLDQTSVEPLNSDLKKAEKKTIDISPDALKIAKERITKAVSQSGTLWTLGKNGVLLYIDTDGKAAKVFEYANYVSDIYQNDANEFFVLASDQADSTEWQILKKIGDSWFVLTTLKLDSEPQSKADGPELIGLAEFDHQTLVFARTKLYLQQRDGEWQKVRLSSREGYGLQTPFAVTDDGFLYVGLNYGEFGGGLVRINVKDGTSKLVEKKSRGNICSQPLDAKCDPVTSIVKDPSDGSAVLVGVGLRHFESHGRILKVTKDDVVVVFNKTYKYDEEIHAPVPKNPCLGQNDPSNLDSFQTEGVFGMQSGQKGIWAVTGRAVYNIANAQIETCAQLPEKFERTDGILVSRAIPGVVLIGTDINWEKSLSGTTPLIAVER